MPNFLEDYEPVEDRLRAFWSEHPNGRVETLIVPPVVAVAEGPEVTGNLASEPGEIILFRAAIYRSIEDSAPASIGWAHQRILAEPPKKRNGEPNYDAPEWTSPFEVAETSAIGRALANLGYAAKGKRPSREEMSKASAPSPTGEKPRLGEAGGADTGPGEGSRTSSGPTTCDHRYPSGAPAKVIKGGREICKLCGVPWVVAMEGTTEDLGPA